MRESRRWRFNALFSRDFKRAFKRELNLAGGFFAGASMRHDTGPFDDLGDETLVAFLGRIPNANFVVARIRTHLVFSSWVEIQLLQLLSHLPYLIGLGFSAGSWLQIQEA